MGSPAVTSTGLRTAAPHLAKGAGPPSSSSSGPPLPGRRLLPSGSQRACEFGEVAGRVPWLSGAKPGRRWGPSWRARCPGRRPRSGSSWPGCRRRWPVADGLHERQRAAQVHRGVGRQVHILQRHEARLGPPVRLLEPELEVGAVEAFDVVGHLLGAAPRLSRVLSACRTMTWRSEPGLARERRRTPWGCSRCRRMARTSGPSPSSEVTSP